VEQEIPIVVLEPGCYSALRDEHPLLLRGERQREAQAVAEACVTFEEWAARAFGSGGGAGKHGGAPFRAGPSRLLLHGHCHQKSLVGTGPAVRLLAAIPGCEVTDLDGGCCGMAGSFGYEREHYEISRRVGEHRLLPAVRAAPPESVVVASGFSCRHQIRHFTGVKAVHPAVLLRSLLAE
jgi:Fe-S oxidoreductase